MSLTANWDDLKQIEATFIVPYQRNPFFMGRDKFLEIIKERLSVEAPKKYNHRIALHGMGGVGKTQCALEYVYANRTTYERIYWISAVNQSSLISDYQKIAKMSDVSVPRNASPLEIAQVALIWLHTKRSWLIVIDNLDDVSVAKGFLPENGLEKHTLITTRNPFTTDIPAEPLEVTILEEGDSIDLFLSLAKVDTSSESSQQAAEIVKELGYLPLAINQAAAYVRQVTGDLVTYFQEYCQNRRDIYKWPFNSRDYPHSVSTTWSMSFKVLRDGHQQAIWLLQLFAFLNPDGILIPFLQKGASVFSKLQPALQNLSELAKALIELEKFSLIKWDRSHKSVSIHRLMQRVVKDDMWNWSWRQLKQRSFSWLIMHFRRNGTTTSSV